MTYDNDELNDAALRQAAQRLGARSGERVDVERVAQAVLERLRERPDARAWAILPPVWLKVAAALVIVIGGAALTRTLWQRPPHAAAWVGPGGAELNTLSANQLEQVLQAVAEPGGDQDALSTQDVGLEELSAPELKALLQSLEG